MSLRQLKQSCVHTALYCFALSFFLLLPALSPTTSAQSLTDGQSGSTTGKAATQQGSPSASIATISGTVVDQAGAVAVGAQIELAQPGGSVLQKTTSGDNGQFSFLDVPPGPYQLTVTASGFDPKTVIGSIHAGEAQIAPEIVLAVAATTTSVKVTADTEEIAQQQIEYQEKQRVLGFIPNFYASYVPDAAPLVPRQKFQLGWKSVTDPISILGVGFLAGIYQASDQLNGYGQGAEGYGKRFGAIYGDVFIGTFIDSAILPSLLHQDPRYFYRGPDASGSRFLYAIGNAVICKGDNKKYQFNYSAVLGSFITSGISQAYYPSTDRGTSLYFQTALIRIAEGSVAGLFQEYVVKKLTPHLKKDPPPQP